MPALELTLFLYVGRNPLGFDVSIEMELVFVCRPEITRLKFIDRIHLVLNWGRKLTCFLCLG